MKLQKSNLSQGEQPYQEFEKLNGEHSFKRAVPSGAVEYQVRTRRGGQVVFFNFPLAKEMGLIPPDHPDHMNERLERKLLDTFSLVIINEYDIAKNTHFNEKDIRPNRYMATRYLQLQHPNKQGKTSGDGRGIWNAEFRGKSGITWDISSSGTGATCLSPAAALTGKNFKTGDKRVGYGNGYNTLDEGMSAALMSEIFHQNNVATERTLVIIGFSGAEKGTSINVRAGQNLIRPSHFFCHLKQGQLESLKATVDYYFARQIQNSEWPKHLGSEEKYRFFSDEIARTFARSAAVFESEYIFCWMDWDGDNVLANGGIIDYGSVRQFGMYYGDYRYDDVDRFSTCLPEQRIKARYIVQCFAQIRDFLITGSKKNIRKFRHDPALKIFDREFELVYLQCLLKKVGFSAKNRTILLEKHLQPVMNFRRIFSYLERVRSKKGVYSVPDGQNRDVVFSMRDLLREYPRRLLEQIKQGGNPTLESQVFTDLMASGSARPEDLQISPFRERRISEFQAAYRDLLGRLSSQDFKAPSTQRLLLETMMRSSLINQPDRITGDAAVVITNHLIRWHKKIPTRALHEVFRELVQHQHFTLVEQPQISVEKALNLSQERDPWKRHSKGKSKKSALVLGSLKLIRKYRKSL
ncbi:protein adenylyltransferase SelO family protein [Bdellovibrionota bacterium FG-1]